MESEVQIVTRLIGGRTAIGIQDFSDSKTHAQKGLILRKLLHWQHRIQNVGNALVKFLLNERGKKEGSSDEAVYTHSPFC